MGTLRIISGKWRGRKITFPNIVGLRPTPDMVRETLFNWLGPDGIINKTCLDLFAGSGALSFEALSRGARLVVAAEKNKKIASYLKETAKLLNADNFMLLHAEIPKQLSTIPSEDKFDVVFLDPPFHHNLIPVSIAKLEENNFLEKKALLYLECEKDLDIQSIPVVTQNYQILHSQTQGQVRYSLIVAP